MYPPKRPQSKSISHQNYYLRVIQTSHVISAIESPSIRQWEVHGEEAQARHSLLPADLSAILDCKLSPILELPEGS